MSEEFSIHEAHEYLSRCRYCSDFRERAKLILKEIFTLTESLDDWFVPAAEGEYTRHKIVGSENLSIWGMEWGGNVFSPPHEHHGELCSPLVLEGRLNVVEVAAREREDGYYDLEKLAEFTAWPGMIATVPDSDMHAMHVPGKSRSVHIYGVSRNYSWCYFSVDQKGVNSNCESAYRLVGAKVPWVRKKCDLRED